MYEYTKVQKRADKVNEEAKETGKDGRRRREI